jgi:hypothetical protein
MIFPISLINGKRSIDEGGCSAACSTLAIALQKEDRRQKKRPA